MAVMVILVEMVIQESVVEMVSEAKEVKAVSEVMTDFQVLREFRVSQGMPPMVPRVC